MHQNTFCVRDPLGPAGKLKHSSITPLAAIEGVLLLMGGISIDWPHDGTIH